MGSDDGPISFNSIPFRQEVPETSDELRLVSKEVSDHVHELRYRYSANNINVCCRLTQ